MSSSSNCRWVLSFACGEEYRPSSRMLTQSNDVVDGPGKLLKQSFELPVGFRFLACPTVLERASDQSSQSRIGLLDLPRLAGGIPPGVTGVGTPKRRCTLTCFVESCATDATFLLCLLIASLFPPKYHCKSIVQQPQI